MAAHSYHYHHRRIPRFGELAEIIDDVNVKKSQYAINEAVEPFKLHPISMSYIY